MLQHTGMVFESASLVCLLQLGVCRCRRDLAEVPLATQTTRTTFERKTYP